MANTWDGVDISDLNYYMKVRDSNVIIPDQFTWHSLYDDLKAGIRTDGFEGDMIKHLIQTDYPFTGQAHGENKAIPYPGTMGFTPVYIPLKEVIANAGLSRQALRRATGGGASWGRLVEDVLAAEREDFLWLMELCAFGDGTGRLARVSANAGTTAVTLTCDNTYKDFGIENVALLKKGMWIEAYSGTNQTIISDASGATQWKVTGVTFGDRNNGASTTGTFTFTTSSDIHTSFVDGTVIYLAGTRSKGITADANLGSFPYMASGQITKCYLADNIRVGTDVDVYTSLPMGLLGIIQTDLAYDADHDYSDGDGISAGNVNCTLDTFQGVARATHSLMNAKFYGAGDYGGTDGTPTDTWDLGDIANALEYIRRNTQGKTNVLYTSSKLAMAIQRLNESHHSYQVVVGSAQAINQTTAHVQYATQFLCPDGRVIPVKVSDTIPDNILYGLCMDDYTWYNLGGYDFLRLNGQIWDKSYNDRYTNFEAPYGGFSQLGITRCDRQFCMQDLSTNV